ncbi:hypothetical protein AOX55_00006255 (plasmid) [Sinorhizobium fredii CCBAU 25509]|nr:hypothetical protein AOX55_00006255 [Sinorhizobium fredii CCBAU 25509]
MTPIQGQSTQADAVAHMDVYCTGFFLVRSDLHSSLFPPFCGALRQ